MDSIRQLHTSPLCIAASLLKPVAPSHLLLLNSKHGLEELCNEGTPAMYLSWMSSPH